VRTYKSAHRNNYAWTRNLKQSERESNDEEGKIIFKIEQKFEMLSSLLYACKAEIITSYIYLGQISRCDQLLLQIGLTEHFRQKTLLNHDKTLSKLWSLQDNRQKIFITIPFKSTRLIKIIPTLLCYTFKALITAWWTWENYAWPYNANISGGH
jgi:hypothetical protein